MTDPNRHLLENHEYLQHLGIGIDEQSEGEVTLSLPHYKSLTNPGSDAMQGGVVSALVDHAATAAVRTTLEDPLEVPHATADLEVTYVRPAAGDLTAVGDVVRTGGSLGVVSVEVTAETPDWKHVVAVGTVSIHINRP